MNPTDNALMLVCAGLLCLCAWLYRRAMRAERIIAGFDQAKRELRGVR